MRIRDDVFLNAAAEQPEHRKRLSAADVALLRGIGDRDFRSAQDTLQDAGLIDADTGVFTAGKQVEYTTPDGIVRTGAISKQATADSWLVSVDDNTYNIVPTAELRLVASAKPDVNLLRAAAQKPVISTLREHRAAEARGNDLSVVLAYNAGQRPADDDVAAYVAANYDGARVLDVADTQPGKLALVITHEAAVPAIPAQERSPGLAAEELEGNATNTPIAAVTAAITTLAAELPHTVHVTSTEHFAAPDKTQAVRANFELLAADNSKLYLRGNELTTDDTSVPAVGYVDSVSKTAMLYGAEGEFVLSLPVTSITAAAMLRIANPVLTAATWLIEHPAAVAAIVKAYPAVRDFVQGDVTFESAKKLVEEIGPDVVSTFMKNAGGGADAYQSGHGPQSMHEDEDTGFEDGSYVITAADLQKEAGPWSKVLGPAALGLGLSMASPPAAQAQPSGQQPAQVQQVDVSSKDKEPFQFGKSKDPKDNQNKFQFGKSKDPKEVAQEREDAAEQKALQAKWEKSPARAYFAEGQSIKLNPDGSLSPAVKARYNELKSVSIERGGGKKTEALEAFKDGIQWQMNALQKKGADEREAASPATDEDDGDVREVLIPPESPDFKQQITAVDQTTKDYYKEYYGEDFGDALTKDVPRKKHKAQMSGVPIAQAVSGLAALAVSDAKVKERVSEGLRNYLSRGSKDALVDTLKRVDTSNTLLPKLIYAAFSDPQSANEFSKIYVDNRKNMPIGEMPNAADDAAAPAPTAKDDAAVAKPQDPFAAQDTSPVQQLAKDQMQLDAPPSLSSQYGPSAETPAQPGGQLPAAGPGVREFDPETQQWFDRAGSKRKAANPLSCMRMTDAVRDGDYIAATVVWDPDECANMSAGNVRQSVISFVKGEATKKETHDYGVIGRPVIMMFDPEAGMAEVRFRSSESRAVPPKVVL